MWLFRLILNSDKESWIKMVRIKVKTFLEKYDKYDGIICFGSGKIFRNILSVIDEDMQKRIIGVVDNDASKHGQTITIGEKEIHINSLSEFMLEDLKNKLLIITPVKSDDIVKQLNEIKEFDNLEYIWGSAIYETYLDEKAKLVEVPSNLKTTTEKYIPKIIHYCWFGGNPLPKEFQKYIDSWKKYCPDYEIIEWNESNYDIEKNLFMKQAYEHKKWAFVSDVARLDVIYNYGGLYMDSDVEVLSNLDDFLYNNCFFGFELPTSCTSLFGAEKNNVFIKKLLDYYDKRAFVDENGVYDMTTNAKIWFDFLERAGFKANGEYQHKNGITLYPEKVLSGKSLCTLQVSTTENTKAIHHFAGSWIDDKFEDENIYNIWKKSMQWEYD